MEESWTIVELAELAAEVLAAPTDGADGRDAADGQDGTADVGPARSNGRVRDVPNERLIRWYGTVGLVDPPLSRRGRVARYGRRHLLQLVAVKRRQAEGRSLAEIQAELAGATDEALAAVARVPASGPAPSPAPPGPAPTPGPGRFWARSPRAADAESQSAVAVPYRDGVAPPVGGLVHGIRLAPGVMLLLDGADREPGPDDLAEITNAARPLLRELVNRGLSASGPHDPAEADHPPKGTGYEH